MHRLLIPLAAALVVAVATVSPAAASEPYGGVELMTAAGEHMTGTAAAREYEALQSQPTINCGSCPKYVVITPQKMPFIARNINMAFKAGKPYVLHKVGKAIATVNRSKACAGFQPNYGGSCDEYPFASSVEGGGGAQTQEVPLREQLCQGGTLRRQYQAQEINDGSEFAVVVIDLAAIPSGPYKGTDIARGAGTSC